LVRCVLFFVLASIGVNAAKPYAERGRQRERRERDRERERQRD
jgi:hypothetical protein